MLSGIAPRKQQFSEHPIGTVGAKVLKDDTVDLIIQVSPYRKFMIILSAASNPLLIRSSVLFGTYFEMGIYLKRLV